MQGQYLGQSENRLKEALASADNAAPCILWIDEIEKGLSGATGSNDGGTSTRMVGQFLFWLQESMAKVFVVSTANDVSKFEHRSTFVATPRGDGHGVENECCGNQPRQVRQCKRPCCRFE
ncbi:MAG: AAA family ATPase [Dolichospermum sp.]